MPKSKRKPVTKIGLQRQNKELLEQLEAARAERDQLEVLYKQLREQFKESVRGS
jgi:hypothetical protein